MLGRAITMTKALDKALSRALAALRRPDAKLVRLHGGTAAGFWVELPHNSFRVPDGVAAKSCWSAATFNLSIRPARI